MHNYSLVLRVNETTNNSLIDSATITVSCENSAYSMVAKYLPYSDNFFKDLEKTVVEILTSYQDDKSEVVTSLNTEHYSSIKIEATSSAKIKPTTFIAELSYRISDLRFDYADINDIDSFVACVKHTSVKDCVEETAYYLLHIKRYFFNKDATGYFDILQNYKKVVSVSSDDKISFFKRIFGETYQSRVSKEYDKVVYAVLETSNGIKSADIDITVDSFHIVNSSVLSQGEIKNIYSFQYNESSGAILEHIFDLYKKA